MTLPHRDTRGENCRNRYRVDFSVRGRLRFLSHLEVVDILLSALRRSGVRLALSQGMRPKPLIKVALPRPVGVEAWRELVEVEIVGERDEIDVDSMALSLGAAMPAGMELLAVVPLADSDKAAASRVAGAVYRVALDGQVDGRALQAWVAAFSERNDLVVARRTPSQRRDIDVSGLVRDLQVVPGGQAQVRFLAALTDAGSVKPDEVLAALSTVAGRELRSAITIRESIVLSPTGDGERNEPAEPSLVGADVPDGPAKPWGAC